MGFNFLHKERIHSRQRRQKKDLFFAWLKIDLLIKLALAVFPDRSEERCRHLLQLLSTNGEYCVCGGCMRLVVCFW